jgi:hypothetical protein
MPIPKLRNSSLLFVALLVLSGTVSLAQSNKCDTVGVIPLTGTEPPAIIFIDPPLPGPHKLLLTLVDANHHPLDKAAITL